MSKEQFSFSTFFAKGQYETQVERLAVEDDVTYGLIGLPAESDSDENRIPLVPNSIRTLVGYGHKVIVESNAGIRSSFSDEHYREAGAEVTHDKKRVYSAPIVIKASTPTLEELKLMQDQALLITMLQMPLISQAFIELLREKKITAMAMEHLRHEDGSYPVIRTMSEIAGRLAILIGSEYLAINKGGRGVLLGGISGVPPAKVVVLGAGVVGEHAIRTALGLGASVRVFDNDIDKLIRIQNRIGRPLHTSTINPEYMAYQLTSADVVIGAMHSRKGRASVIVTEEMVKRMKNGAVIVDVSIDQGGCIETSEVTNHRQPTFEKYGVIHYCVPNIASMVGRTSSMAISNILTSLILKICSFSSVEEVLYHHEGIQHGVYTYAGCMTNAYLAQRFDMKFIALHLLIPSSR